MGLLNFSSGDNKNRILSDLKINEQTRRFSNKWWQAVRVFFNI